MKNKRFEEDQHGPCEGYELGSHQGAYAPVGTQMCKKWWHVFLTKLIRKSAVRENVGAHVKGIIPTHSHFLQRRNNSG